MSAEVTVAQVKLEGAIIVMNVLALLLGVAAWVGGGSPHPGADRGGRGVPHRIFPFGVQMLIYWLPVTAFSLSFGGWRQSWEWFVMGGGLGLVLTGYLVSFISSAPETAPVV
jgi:hypothetical protein